MLPFISKAGANSRQEAVDAGTDKEGDQSRLAHGAKVQRAKGTKSNQLYRGDISNQVGLPQRHCARVWWGTEKQL